MLLKCLILLNRCTHMCCLSLSVALFPAFLSSHWKFPQSSVSLVRMKTAYCRRTGCHYRLYLESCLMMTSRWQHQAESSLISGWRRRARPAENVGCIYPFPESLEFSQSNRFTHSILLCLYFYPIHFFSGEGNGNPLQCSCLENPRDREAWWAAVYGVSQSRTRLKWLSNSSIFSHLLLIFFFFCFFQFSDYKCNTFCHNHTG